jgi:hypothetical protein
MLSQKRRLSCSGLMPLKHNQDLPVSKKTLQLILLFFEKNIQYLDFNYYIVILQYKYIAMGIIKQNILQKSKMS